MLVIHFDGWFQCRLATNPDPTDEPRGVSGYTFALPGEPDLDRIIRLQNPVAPRSHGPEVGVRVNAVTVHGHALADHPMVGAPVAWLDDPKFESRNLLLTDDRAGIGLINPFHIHMAGVGMTIRRVDVLYPDDPDRKLHQIPPEFLRRRAPLFLHGMTRDPIRVADATGMLDPLAYRQQRKERLEADLRRTTNPIAQAALAKRIRELDVTDPANLRVLALSLVQRWHFVLNGPAEVLDPEDRLGGTLDLAQAWPIEFWMGGWDADALCGYLRGVLSIPFQPSGELSG
jgi:hypothetical protein